MQETLYDNLGEPVAYIDYSDGMTIYLWSGVPVAYLFSNSLIYGFNGAHLGWFENGFIRDSKGQIVGVSQTIGTAPKHFKPVKGLKQIKPLKMFRRYPHFKPLFFQIRSQEPLSQFLARGR